MIPFYEPQLKLNDYERCSKVTLAFPVEDLKDWYGKRFYARILTDRSGVLIKKPIMPASVSVC